MIDYPWKRFWRPPIGRLNLADDGYLVDPEGPWGERLNPDVKVFDAFGSVPCLALLGEPGTGKSRELETAYGRARTLADAAGNAAVYLELRSVDSSEQLTRALFQDPVFETWLAGSHRLELFLDSLDEGALQWKAAAAVLARELRVRLGHIELPEEEYASFLERHPEADAPLLSVRVRLPGRVRLKLNELSDAQRADLGRAYEPLEARRAARRLRLRLTCRTADWPLSLERALVALWGREAVQVYELAPLRRLDVLEAARTEGFPEPERLLEEIARMGAVELAVKPVTLRLLMRKFRASGRLPSGTVALYEEGCELLAGDPSAFRHETGQAGRLSARERLAVASRIAAVTVLGAKAAVAVFPAGEQPAQETDVLVGALAGGSEPVGQGGAADQVQVSEAAVLETLSSGLFSSRGEGRLGWAHQTYAEYLAARFLARRGLGRAQALSLLLHSVEGRRRVVPQLREVAAWYAGMDRAAQETILELDPEVLLGADETALDDGTRAAVVDRVLGLADQGLLSPNPFYARERYRRLAHPGLTAHLTPWIVGEERRTVARVLALEIAEACAARELLGPALDVALNPGEDLWLRARAAGFVREVGDGESRARLKPLAVGKAGDDPEDELKGVGLSATWPDALSAPELFDALTPAKQGNLFGTYKHFLVGEHFWAKLSPSDIGLAFAWMGCHEDGHEPWHEFEDAYDGILELAWEHLDRPDALRGFALYALHRIRKYADLVGHDSNLRQRVLEDDGRRRRVLSFLVEELGEDLSPMELAHSEPRLLVSGDTPWLLERLEAAGEEATREHWAALVVATFDPGDGSQLSAMTSVAERDAVLRRHVDEWHEAVRRAEAYRREHAEGRPQPRRPLLEPPPSRRVAGLLGRAEAGEPDAWWHLTMDLTLRPDSTHYSDELQRDLRELPGWQEADPVTRGRIIAAARRYVQDRRPAPDEWLGTNTLHRPDFAGFKALRLLRIEDPAFLDTLGPAVWARWAPVVLAYPGSSESAKNEIERDLLLRAYRGGPDEFVVALERLIDVENQEGHVFVVRRLEGLWDERLAGATISAVVRDDRLRPQNVGEMLDPLLRQGRADAVEVAAGMVRGGANAEGRSRAVGVAAARSLVVASPGEGWPLVWPLLRDDPAYADEVLEGVAWRGGWPGEVGYGGLDEMQVAELVRWLEDRYPRAEDPKRDGREMHEVTRRDQMADFRDGLLNHLRGRGTVEAVAAIRWLERELPHQEWLSRARLEAEDQARRRTWVPPQPSAVLDLAGRERARLVRDEDELVDVVLEVLEELDRDLRAETPASVFLWNDLPAALGRASRHRPKDEAALSDFVKRFLQDRLERRGVVLGREVEIRPFERTDILVAAVARRAQGDGYDRLSLVIEVKGNWNRDVPDSMGHQLARRYLRENSYRHGLYLVGWFPPDDRWDREDRTRRSQAARLGGLEAFRRDLEHRAADLSRDGLSIRAVVLDASLPAPRGAPPGRDDPQA